jgi:hypothetical protein
MQNKEELLDLTLEQLTDMPLAFRRIHTTRVPSLEIDKRAVMHSARYSASTMLRSNPKKPTSKILR